MGRNHSSVDLNRGVRKIDRQKHFILFVEGKNTEYSYFKLLKENCCSVIPVVVKGNGISACVDFVNESIKKFNCFNASKREKYSQKWLVFDYDGRKDFSQAIQLARENDFKVAFSSMCIEYWFDLHFINHNGGTIPMNGSSHSQAQINIINKFINKYNKTAKNKVNLYDDESKKIKEDLFDLMLSINPTTKNRRIIDAYVQACKIHSKKVSNGCEFDESVTTIYELLRELGVIYFENGTYGVNIK